MASLTDSEDVAGEDGGAAATDLSVLNVVVAPPECRSGAVRAGLHLGHHLDEFVDVDTVKMSGDHDDQLRAETGTTFDAIPSHTAVRDAVSWLVGDEKNYTNAVISTRVHPPRPLSSYDLVHVHNPIPLVGFAEVALQSRLAGVPYCVTTHGIDNVPEFPDHMGMSRPTELAFRIGYLRPYYWVLRNATHLFALTRSDVERLEELSPAGSISRVGNGVEPDPPRTGDAAAAARTFDLDPEETVALFVGEWTPRKGFDCLLEIAEDLPEGCRLVAAGPSKYEEYERAAGAAPNVVDVGYVPKDDLRLLYRRADAFVFPTRSDVLPMVVFEAMAAKTPVVSTRVGGVPEQVTHDCGVLVEPGDVDALRRAVTSLLEDDSRRERLAEGAFRRASESFSWKQVARETAATYRTLCDAEPVEH